MDFYLKGVLTMTKRNDVVRTMCEVGLFAAIGFILDELQGALAISFPAGGSIGIAMIAVLIVAYRRGVFPAIFTGLIMGALDLLSKAYIYHPVQVFLDYIFPYALVGLAGLFKPLFDKAEDKKHAILWLIVGTAVGGMAKFLSHYISGVAFFNYPDDFAWGLNHLNGWLYSFIYNIAFIAPCILLSGGLLVLVYWRAPIVLNAPQYEEVVERVDAEKQNKKVYSWGVTIGYIAGGIVAFVWYLIDYIKNVKIQQKTGYIKFSSSQDSMLICVVALIFIIAGIISLIKLLKNKNPDTLLAIVFPVASGAITLYAVAKIIAIAVDGGVFADYRLYIYWMIIAFLLCVLGVIGLANHIKQKKGEEI